MLPPKATPTDEATEGVTLFSGLAVSLGRYGGDCRRVQPQNLTARPLPGLAAAARDTHHPALRTAQPTQEGAKPSGSLLRGRHGCQQEPLCQRPEPTGLLCVPGTWLSEWAPLSATGPQAAGRCGGQARGFSLECMKPLEAGVECSCLAGCSLRSICPMSGQAHEEQGQESGTSSPPETLKTSWWWDLETHRLLMAFPMFSQPL